MSPAVYEVRSRRWVLATSEHEGTKHDIRWPLGSPAFTENLSCVTTQGKPLYTHLVESILVFNMSWLRRLAVPVLLAGAALPVVADDFTPPALPNKPLPNTYIIELEDGEVSYPDPLSRCLD